MISLPHPGFLVLCANTCTPVLAVSVVAWDKVGSRELVPEELDTIKRRGPGYSDFSRAKVSFERSVSENTNSTSIVVTRDEISSSTADYNYQGIHLIFLVYLILARHCEAVVFVYHYSSNICLSILVRERLSKRNR